MNECDLNCWARKLLAIGVAGSGARGDQISSVESQPPVRWLPLLIVLTPNQRTNPPAYHLNKCNCWSFGGSKKPKVFLTNHCLSTSSTSTRHQFNTYRHPVSELCEKHGRCCKMFVNNSSLNSAHLHADGRSSCVDEMHSSRAASRWRTSLTINVCFLDIKKKLCQMTNFRQVPLDFFLVIRICAAISRF